MAFDIARGRAVLFGGTASQPLNGVWQYETAPDKWQQLEAPQSCPSGPAVARSEYALEYDPLNQLFWIFGGTGFGCADSARVAGKGTTTTAIRDDTLPATTVDFYKGWTVTVGDASTIVSAYNPGTKTLTLATALAGAHWWNPYVLSPPRAVGTVSYSAVAKTWGTSIGSEPANRLSPAMAYSTRDAAIVMFGGQGLNDTWVLDARTKKWRQAIPGQTVGSPPGLAELSNSMVYDSENDIFVLFGGCLCTGNAGQSSADTWAYQLSTNSWTRMTPPVSPPARQGHNLVYDSANKRVVLFGGFDSTSGTYYNDLWIYSFATNAWTLMFPSTSPPARGVGAMVYDPVQQRTVLYGGKGPGSLSDVWSLELKPPTAGGSGPALTSLSPNSVTTGSPSFTLTVTGANFGSSSVVRWNGVSRPTTYVRSSLLQASIPASDVVSAGTAQVSVSATPGSGGGISNALPVTVLPLAPVPVLSSITPATVPAGGAGFTVTVTGTGFTTDSVVRINGANRATKFVSATQLTASIVATDVAAPGAPSITVFTPAPGGGTSGARPLTVASATLAVSATSALPGAPLTVTLANAPGGSTDWLGFTASANPDTAGSFTTRTYVGAGVTTRTWTINTPATSGQYEFRFFTNDGYVRSATSPTITVVNPTPAITALSPASLVAGGGALTLTVTGSGFASGATATVKGEARTATVDSATQVRISLLATDLATQGAVAIQVTNAAPCAGGFCLSNSASLNLLATPTPTLTSLAPASVVAGGGAFTLTATGTNFSANSVVQVNGSARPTTFVSSSQLTAALLAADVGSPAALSVTVVVPAPNGGTSNAQTLTVTSQPSTTTPAPTIKSLRGDCSSEGGLVGRTDIVFCEPWENANWWTNGYEGDGTKSIDRWATSADVTRATVVSTGCLSGQCLRLDMLKGETRALALHWPLKNAGIAPDELYLRYYMKLSPNFNPYSADASGQIVGQGGKFPGLADVRTTSDPSGQCGNGGETGDGVNCWSMRAEYAACYSGDGTACSTKPGASVRYGSYLYFYRQEAGEGSYTGHNGNWDSNAWGTFRGDGGTCGTTANNTYCGIGDGGVLYNDRWYRMEMRVRMNTPGQADGIIQGWVDGVLSYEKKNMIFRIPGHDNLHNRTVWLDVYKGGVYGNYTDQQVYLDQMVIALNDKPGPWIPAGASSPALTAFGTVTPAPPATLTLAYNGQLRDRVGQGETALAPDRALDGTLTVTLSGGGRTVTGLRLDSNAPGTWDTRGGGFWVLAVAPTLDGALLNASGTMAVNFPVADGGSFVVFASDYLSGEFLPGRMLTLTATFSDGSTATAMTTVPVTSTSSATTITTMTMPASPAVVTTSSSTPTTAPGTWAALPGTALAPVIWKDALGRSVNELKGGNAWYTSLSMWNGAGYRYDTDTMVFPALGGHQGGADNSVYSVNMRTPSASRDFDATVDIIPNVWEIPANAFPRYVDTKGEYGPAGLSYPSSAHRYDGMVHVEGTDYIWVGGGPAWGPSTSTSDIFLWDTKNKKWTWMDQDPLLAYESIIAATYDPVGKRVLYIDSLGIVEWVLSRPAGQRARRISTFPQGQDTSNRFKTLLVDVKRNRLVAAGVTNVTTGASQILYWDLTTLQPGVLNASTAAFPAWSLASPGFDIDVDNDRYLIYSGGNTLRWVNPATGSVTLEQTAGAPAVIDTNGTWGRMRYSRNLKAVVFTQDMFAGTWVYQVRQP